MLQGTPWTQVASAACMRQTQAGPVFGAHGSRTEASCPSRSAAARLCMSSSARFESSCGPLQSTRLLNCGCPWPRRATRNWRRPTHMLLVRQGESTADLLACLDASMPMDSMATIEKETSGTSLPPLEQDRRYIHVLVEVPIETPPSKRQRRAGGTAACISVATELNRTLEADFDRWHRALYEQRQERDSAHEPAGVPHDGTERQDPDQQRVLVHDGGTRCNEPRYRCRT